MIWQNLQETRHLKKQVPQLQPHCFVLFLSRQQNSQTDHYPGERKFKTTTDDFMTLLCAVLRIIRVLLEVGLEKERKSVFVLGIPKIWAVQQSLGTDTPIRSLLSRKQTGAAFSWCHNNQVYFLPLLCSSVMPSIDY